MDETECTEFHFQYLFSRRAAFFEPLSIRPPIFIIWRQFAISNIPLKISRSILQKLLAASNVQLICGDDATTDFSELQLPQFQLWFAEQIEREFWWTSGNIAVPYIIEFRRTIKVSWRCYNCSCCCTFADYIVDVIDRMAFNFKGRPGSFELFFRHLMSWFNVHITKYSDQPTYLISDPLLLLQK
ncbi:Hypothetical_protein [Hexamita inflata]|uniref:Hypothetical_protein n=1 Tax=Hexamita inflata TaxID=28002 RepID=A0AA86U9U8_9EUKA|nr:Hypothetical protein HINF_LOCUS36855 [Hexamita inflata]